MTEGYLKLLCVSHSWLCGVVVKTPDWESVGCEFKYSNFLYLERKA